MPEPTFTAETADLNYYLRQMAAAGRTNLAYLGLGEDGQTADTSKMLSQTDVRAARLARAIRRAILVGLKTKADIHLTFALGREERYANRDLTKMYRLRGPRIGAMEDLDRVELTKAQLDVAAQLADFGRNLGLDARLWTTHLLITFLDIPADMVIRLLTKNPLVVTTPGGELVAPQESLAKGLHPLNESERAVLTSLAATPRISSMLRRLSETLDTAQGITNLTDTSRIIPIADNYVSRKPHSDARLLSAIEENINIATARRGN
jgi:hypothetical protein